MPGHITAERPLQVPAGLRIVAAVPPPPPIRVRRRLAPPRPSSAPLWIRGACIALAIGFIAMRNTSVQDATEASGSTDQVQASIGPTIVLPPIVIRASALAHRAERAATIPIIKDLVYREDETLYDDPLEREEPRRAQK